MTPEDDPQKLFTEACLRGLRAKLCNDDDSLADYLPPQVAAMARKVADALEVPQPATVRQALPVVTSERPRSLP
ncbi:hypothetical protein [Streptomyces sp. NBC_00057]|uniref:hypothetical protein n=1 Tax=Streptomyces sp. NBC_00057 TaxID=2975634 RepID=UPI00324F8623